MIEYERTYQFCKILVNTIHVSNDFFLFILAIQNYDNFVKGNL